MKIWDILTGQVIYDNQLGAVDYADQTTVIAGGSIVIQKEWHPPLATGTESP